MRAAFLRCVLSLSLLLALPALAANDLSPKDLDMVCAITSAAEMRTNSENSETQTAAATLWVFYLGRLSARDDVTDDPAATARQSVLLATGHSGPRQVPDRSRLQHR